MTKVLQDFFLNVEAIQSLSNLEKKKYFQKLQITQHLYLNGANTHAELCSTLDFSPPTSKALINQLRIEKLVDKQGRGESVGGRKPNLYGLRKKTFFVLSIHIERFAVKLAIIDNTHNIIEEREIPLKNSSEVNIVEFLFNYANDLFLNSKIDTKKLLGIGMSMPGLVSSKEGKNFTYFLTGQESESLQDALIKRFAKPVYILNDVNSACLAEFWFGQAKNKTDALVISMDWGIGLGIIMGGKFQTGTSGFAGEFGHIPIVENGKLCHCGKRGCLETVASGIALVDLAIEGLEKEETSLLKRMINNDAEKLKPELIIEAANRGDQFAINLISEIGLYLGKGISILIQIFNPEIIILGGKITEAKQFITIPVQQSINTYCMIQLKERTIISLSQLGTNANLLGSTISVVNNVFQSQLVLEKTEFN